ncbi:acyltransferase family protein [Acidicapsa dinghuensis]|uniref:Acyltransferase family protein n=1 Tax=Acidicapsa dinghuensis TaxID=2218256 RepID=A0ABW1ELJ4_9BACT|nr:acyltransferase [Acidicapsa dinghuensis]
MLTQPVAAEVALRTGHSQPVKIHALTTVRFFAALYVVLFHLRGHDPSGFLFGVLSLGYVAPYFFFALSGYILSVVYLRDNEAVDARRFFVARFARIYPLYILCLLLDLPFAILGRVAAYGLPLASLRSVVLFLRSAVMMQMLAPLNNALNIPSWTIAVEAVFYLSFPWLGPWLWKLGKRGALFAMPILFLAGTGLDRIIVRGRGETLPSIYGMVAFLCVFASGMALARWQALDRREAGRFTRGKGAWLGLPVALTIFLVVVAIRDWLKTQYLSPAYLLLPAFLLLLWSLTEDRTFVTGWMKAKWLVVLGEASYALYLLQHPVGNMFKLAMSLKLPWEQVIYVCVCIGLSLLSFYFFETPSRKWLLRWLNTRPKESMEKASLAQ